MDADTPRNDRPPSITDVAKAAGVSSVTVSRVLRGESNVKPSTAQKVEKAVLQLGYRRNPMVQALMSAVRRKSVAVESNIAWLPQPRKHDPARTDARLRQLQEGARERAIQLGFGFEPIMMDQPPLSRERLRNLLDARGVRGAVIAPLAHPSVLPNIPWDHFSIATIGRSLREPLISHAMLHCQHAVERVLKEVSARGYRRIAFLGMSDAVERSDNLQWMVCHAFQLRQDPADRIEPVSVDGWTNERFKSWLKQTRPDAIIASYPQHIQQIREQNLPFLAEAGYATLSWREEYPQIAGLRHPMDILGAAAIDIVVAQIHRNERGIPERPKTMLIEGDWIEGSTL